MQKKVERLLKYLKVEKSITSLEAIKELGDTRLSATIYELKKEGFEIDKISERSLNRFGEKVCFDRYFLAKDKAKVLKQYAKMLKEKENKKVAPKKDTKKDAKKKDTKKAEPKKNTKTKVAPKKDTKVKNKKKAK